MMYLNRELGRWTYKLPANFLQNADNWTKGVNETLKLSQA